MKRTPLNKGNKGLKKGKGLSQRRSLKPKKKKSLKPLSISRKAIEEEYRKACKEISEDRGHWCQGCGSSSRPLSYSHLIPRSVRKDLIAVKKNIHIHCLEWDGIVGCHKKHETQMWDDMKDRDIIKESMIELDHEYYKSVTE